MSDDLPERPKSRLNILPLDELGIAELQSYVTELRTEIARVDSVIDRKRAHRGAADLVFGKPKN